VSNRKENTVKDIVVPKETLLAKLRENRDAHQAIFEEAVEGYKKRAVELLEGHIERIRKGSLERVHVVLPMPENHKDDYDRVIAMLEMDISNTVEIPEDDFTAYVMDDWAWKHGFLTSTASYSDTASAMLGKST
jgi:hypothetical protein